MLKVLLVSIVLSCCVSCLQAGSKSSVSPSMKESPGSTLTTTTDASAQNAVAAVRVEAVEAKVEALTEVIAKLNVELTAYRKEMNSHQSGWVNITSDGGEIMSIVLVIVLGFLGVKYKGKNKTLCHIAEAIEAFGANGHKEAAVQLKGLIAKKEAKKFGNVPKLHP